MSGLAPVAVSFSSCRHLPLRKTLGCFTVKEEGLRESPPAPRARCGRTDSPGTDPFLVAANHFVMRHHPLDERLPVGERELAGTPCQACEPRRLTGLAPSGRDRNHPGGSGSRAARRRFRAEGFVTVATGGTGIGVAEGGGGQSRVCLRGAVREWAELRRLMVKEGGHRECVSARQSRSSRRRASPRRPWCAKRRRR